MWVAPPGQTLALSVLLREPPALLPLRAGLAVADVAGPDARVKWPNDVLVDGLKVSGILVEGRPAEGWAVLGIGVNAALDLDALPPELRGRAGTLGRPLEPTLAALLDALRLRLSEPPEATVAGLQARDALLGRPVRWGAGEGVGAGIDADGSLRVRRADGSEEVLDAGEVHLGG